MAKPRLQQKYIDQSRQELREKFKFDNEMRIPRLSKVIVNMGLGEARDDSKRIAKAKKELALIVGQRPVTTRARKAVSSFRLRQGMPIGCKVTLRRDRMWEFLDRLITVAIPRIRDFRGLKPNSFDGHGNYSMGLNEQIVFPEVPIDDVEFPQGMDITVVTTARTDEEGFELLKSIGMPFRRN